MSTQMLLGGDINLASVRGKELRQGYSNAFRSLYMALIISYIWIYGASIFLGEEPDGVNLYIVVGIMILIQIFGYYRLSMLYPNINGFLSRVIAGAFGIIRVGWDQPGFKNLPWGVLSTWGVIAMVLHPYVGVMLIEATIPEILEIVAINIGFLFLAVTIAYGVGYGLRALAVRFNWSEK